VQTIMRHSTPVLTMNRYGHLLPGAEAEAAERLGSMVSPTRPKDDAEKNVVPMTGTDGQDGAQRVAQQSGRVSGQLSATAGDGERTSEEHLCDRSRSRKRLESKLRRHLNPRFEPKPLDEAG
jgi:hypothetical protein